MVVEERDLRPDAVVHSHAGAPRRHAGGDLDQLVVNTIRTLAIDAVEAAGSGRWLARPGGRAGWLTSLRAEQPAGAPEGRIPAAEVDAGHPALLVGVGAQRDRHRPARDQVGALHAVARGPHALGAAAHAAPLMPLNIATLATATHTGSMNQ